ncbi:MAG: tRNA uridine-5-carboxymethylaminomethyl(34) synthesis GTPase MnmE [Bdellovibrionales bacterium]|nr:tRNA uridine-5-carboxymethylaminomethyl(34) synthesis GTPase MnmE [Bdellovibrionales bacterium]
MDTIVAISTSTASASGIGVIRLSGPKAKEIAQRCFFSSEKKIQSHRVYYGRFVDVNEHVLDDGLMVFMKSPKSFTGEDLVEISLHGNPLILSQAVETLIVRGARLARPGEFSERAFLSGKLDLMQVEAIAQLIASGSSEEARQARRRLDGKSSLLITQLMEKTTHLLAQLEADIDFPEEDIDPDVEDQLLQKCQELMDLSKTLLSSYAHIQKLSSGYHVLIAGLPNAGKSTLFNALLGSERAIVTDIAGTTRDTLEEEIWIEGRNIRLIDSAGYAPQTQDPIEKQGISRMEDKLKHVDLLCWICDVSDPDFEAAHKIFASVPPHRRWWIWSKTDLPSPLPPKPDLELDHVLGLSAKSGQGLEAFRQDLQKRFSTQVQDIEGGGIANDRQKNLLEAFYQSCFQTSQSIARHDSPELIAFELRQGYRNLQDMLGQDIDMEKVYDEIFSTFCVGK